MVLLKRIPALSQIIPVYAVIVLVVYSWTILWFFWKLPSWSFFMSVDEILVVIAYFLSVNFLESICVLILLVLLCVVLPQKWFYDAFIVRATTCAILSLVYAMYFTFQMQLVDEYPKSLLLLTFPVFGIIFFLAYLSGKFEIVRKVVESFADRAIIFLYLSIPLSLISIVVVVFRNIA